MNEEKETEEQYAKRKKAETIERMATMLFVFSSASSRPIPMSPEVVFKKAEEFVNFLLSKNPDSDMRWM